MKLSKNENQDVEFKLNWQDEYLKWICSFANSQGGVLYIGVDDNGTIIGVKDSHKLSETIPLKMKASMGLFCPVEILKSDKLEYIKITVEKYPFPVSYHGKYYKRVGSTTQELIGVELDRLILSKQGRTWDSVPVPNVSVNDLENDAINLFRKKAVDSGRMSNSSIEVSNETLINNLHLKENNYLSRAAILTFYPDPEKWITGAFIKIAYFENEADIEFQDEVHGPLLLQVEKAISIIYTKYMKALISYDNLYRKETYFFPESAFRELLLNAVVHKDYLSTTPVQIRIYKDKIYIWNPGKLPSEITAENIYDEHFSIPFNPNLANIFFKCGMVEAWGRGYSKIKQYCQKENAKLPVIDLATGGVAIKCFASESYLKLNNENINDNNSPESRIEIIKNYLKINSSITNSEAVILLNVSSKTANRILNKAVNDGVLIANGENKGRIYSLK